VLEVAGEANWIEFVAVPVADMEGSPEQDVFFRISKIHANGTVLDRRYFDTYSFTGTAGPDLPADVNWEETVTGMGSPANSEVAVDFYRHVLIQKQWWDAEFAFEGVMEFELPRSPGTDGVLLRDQALHVLIKDMIIRQETWFPQYGLLPLWYGQPKNHGCPLTFMGTMAGALELGAFDYARGVLDTFFNYGIRKRHFATPEGVASGADLWAMCKFTRNLSLLVILTPVLTDCL
jgi:hypothetical protein